MTGCPWTMPLDTPQLSTIALRQYVRMQINSFTIVVQILRATSNVSTLSDPGPIISISHL